jgi:hypothetical protein
MLMSDMFPRKYLSGSEVPAPFKATIDHVCIEEVGQANDKKPVLYFREDRKPMILNKTNGNTIALKFGGDTDDWAGAAIIVYTTPVADPSGKTVEGLRVRFPAAKTGHVVQEPAENDMDDSVPF